MYSYAYYRVGNHHDAEDLTEQTFLQAYRHFERARRESRGRPLRPWLIRIAHNLAANLYRDRSRKPATPIDESTTLAAPHTTEQLVEGREELTRVLGGVRRLPEDRREALIMRFALGMDNREIARALGRSDGATKVLIHRAVKQLEGLVNIPARRTPMSEALANFEGLLREALAPVEPPEDLARRLEGTLDEHHRDGRRRAGGMGAVGDARPAQLGSAGCGARGRRRRGGRAGAPARSPAGARLSSGGLSGARETARAHRPRPRSRDAQAARRPLIGCAQRGYCLF